MRISSTPINRLASRSINPVTLHLHKEPEMNLSQTVSASLQKGIICHWSETCRNDANKSFNAHNKSSGKAFSLAKFRKF